MTVKELKAKAKELKLSGYSRMKKDELEAAIQKAEKGKKPAKATKKQPTLEEAQLTISHMSKGEARRYRKQLFAQGLRGHAAVKRIPGLKKAA